MLVKIYALIDPRDGKMRYIGKTRGSLRKRLSEHCQDRRNRHNRHKINWISLLKRQGIRPGIVCLEECDEAVWQERERHWIAHHRSTLTNVEDGGNGSTYIENRKILRPQRRSISESLKEYYRQNPSARLDCARAGMSTRGIPRNFKKKKSAYVGVSFQSRRGKPLSKPWRTLIRIGIRKAKHIGYFLTEVEAARAYDQKARELGYTRLNFPDES